MIAGINIQKKSLFLKAIEDFLVGGKNTTILFENEQLKSNFRLINHEASIFRPIYSLETKQNNYKMSLFYTGENAFYVHIRFIKERGVFKLIDIDGLDLLEAKKTCLLESTMS